MTKNVLLVGAAVLLIAAPIHAAPSKSTIDEGIAFANNLCGDADIKTQVIDDFKAAARLRGQALAVHLVPDTRIVVPDAYAVRAQGYPNGFALENGRIKSVACKANLAMRINGKIVEYRGLPYWVMLEPGKPAQTLTLDPGNAAAFIEPLFIANRSLVPGNDGGDFIQQATAKEMEIDDMQRAGFIARLGPVSPEMRTLWRVQRLAQLLGPAPQ